MSTVFEASYTELCEAQAEIANLKKMCVDAAQNFMDNDWRRRQQIAHLRAALKECADDLEASVNAEYSGTLDYPFQKRKWERAMEPVIKARALIEA